MCLVNQEIACSVPFYGAWIYSRVKIAARNIEVSIFKTVKMTLEG